MNYSIEYNKAIEFICALFKYASNRSHGNLLISKGFKDDAAEAVSDLYSNKKVRKWLQYLDNDVSPFFRNDINLIISKLGRLLDACIKIIIKNNIESSEELIEQIKGTYCLDFIKTIYNEYKLNTPFDSENSVLKEVLTKEFDEETALFFLQTKNHPEEYHDKVIKVFETFNNLYYKPFENKIYKFMEKKLKEQNALFERDNIKFLNTIGLDNCFKAINEGEELKIFVSFFLDLGLFHFNMDDTLILLYGHTMEQRLDKKVNLEETKNLFKVLSDERRLEIIRMTSQRPWYNKELADYFNLTTATLSYHLNLLLDIGILDSKSSMNNRYYYTTNKENLNKMIDSALHNVLEK